MKVTGGELIASIVSTSFTFGVWQDSVYASCFMVAFCTSVAFLVSFHKEK